MSGVSVKHGGGGGDDVGWFQPHEALHGRGVGAGQPQVQSQPPRPLLHLVGHWTVALSVRGVLAPHGHVGGRAAVKGHDDIGALHFPPAALPFLLLFILLLPLLLLRSLLLLLLLFFLKLLPEMGGFALDDWLEGLGPPLAGGGYL